MEEEYTCTKNVGGKSYTVTLVKSQLAFDPLLKMGFPTPAVLTLEQRMQMSWMDWIARIPESEELPHVNYLASIKIKDSINNTAHTIRDHGFCEVTYKEVLKNNIRELRKQHSIYEHGKIR